MLPFLDCGESFKRGQEVGCKVGRSCSRKSRTVKHRIYQQSKYDTIFEKMRQIEAAYTKNMKCWDGESDAITKSREKDLLFFSNTYKQCLER